MTKRCRLYKQCSVFLIMTDDSSRPWRRSAHIRERAPVAITLSNFPSLSVDKSMLSMAHKIVTDRCGVEVESDGTTRVLLHTDGNGVFFTQLASPEMDHIASIDGFSIAAMDAKSLKVCAPILEYVRSKNLCSLPLKAVCPSPSKEIHVRDVHDARQFMSMANDTIHAWAVSTTPLDVSQSRFAWVRSGVFSTFFHVNAKTLSTLGVPLNDARGRLLNAAHVMHLNSVRGVVDAASLQRTDSDIKTVMRDSQETRTKLFVWNAHGPGWTAMPVRSGPCGRFVLMHGQQTACMLTTPDLRVAAPATTANEKSVLQLWSAMQRVSSAYREFDMKDAASCVNRLLASTERQTCPVRTLALARSCLGGALAHALVCSEEDDGSCACDP